VDDLVWREAMSVGVRELDADHQLLVATLKYLRASTTSHDSHALLESLLDFFVDYAVYHFRREERVMEVCAYPQLEAHRARHRDFATTVVAMAKRLDPGDATRSFGELYAFLRRWFEDHVKVEDQAYVASVRRASEAAQAAAREVLPIRHFIAGRLPDRDLGDWSRVSIALVDANPRGRWLLATVLRIAGVQRVGEAEGAADLMQLIARELPDFIALKADRDPAPTFALLDALKLAPRVKPHVVLLVDEADYDFKTQALAKGVRGFVDRPVRAADFLAAIASAGG
jgi:hemerythrin